MLSARTKHGGFLLLYIKIAEEEILRGAAPLRAG